MKNFSIRLPLLLLVIHDSPILATGLAPQALLLPVIMRISSFVATAALLCTVAAEADPLQTPAPGAALAQRAYTYQGWGVSGSVGPNGYKKNPLLLQFTPNKANSACGAVLGFSGCAFGSDPTTATTVVLATGTTTSNSRTILMLTTTTVPNTDLGSTTFYAPTPIATVVSVSDGTHYASTKTYTSTAAVVVASSSSSSSTSNPKGTAVGQTSDAVSKRVRGRVLAALVGLGWLVL